MTTYNVEVSTILLINADSLEAAEAAAATWLAKQIGPTRDVYKASGFEAEPLDDDAVTLVIR